MKYVKSDLFNYHTCRGQKTISAIRKTHLLTGEILNKYKMQACTDRKTDK